MLDIYNISLILDLLPESLANDEEIQAIAYEFDPEFREIMAAISNVRIMENLDNQPEKVLVHLLSQNHILVGGRRIKPS
ncbi:hypothetical protein KHA80_14490 [Anaerobacillus sp. HL2]|nr:hypothetical protein KHA80_14490 [Anaerobacillus sp. HL2]